MTMKSKKFGILTALFMGAATLGAAAPASAQSFIQAPSANVKANLRDNMSAPELTTFITSLAGLSDMETVNDLIYVRKLLRNRPDLAPAAIKALPLLVWSNTKNSTASEIEAILETLIKQDPVENTRLINETWGPFLSAALQDMESKSGSDFYFRFYMYNMLTNLTPELQKQKVGEMWQLLPRGDEQTLELALESYEMLDRGTYHAYSDEITHMLEPAYENAHRKITEAQSETDIIVGIASLKKIGPVTPVLRERTFAFLQDEIANFDDAGILIFSMMTLSSFNAAEVDPAALGRFIDQLDALYGKDFPANQKDIVHRRIIDTVFWAGTANVDLGREAKEVIEKMYKTDRNVSGPAAVRALQDRYPVLNDSAPLNPRTDPRLPPKP